MSEQQPEPEEGYPPPKYKRSVSGLVVALGVTLVVVGLLAVIPAVLNDPPEASRESVDYLEVVRQAQGTGLRPAYPADLPEGWVPTGVELLPGEPVGFSMTMLDDDERFVGLRQENEDIDDLVEELVDEGADEGDEIAVSRSVAERWRSFTDDGGDAAYAAEVGGQTLLVFGSADETHLIQLLGMLTTRRLPPRSSQ